MTQDENTITLKFTPSSMYDLQELAKKLNSNAAEVVAQGLALLKIAQGRTVILKDKNQTLEIDKYAANQPIDANIVK